MNQLVLDLPWPPSNNTYFRHPNKGPLAGRTLISEKGRNYRNEVFGVVLLDMPPPSIRPGRTARLSVALYAYPPDKRRRDLDNLPKAVLDALTHAGVWADDEQIDSLSIQRCDPLKGGRIKVIVTEITESARAETPPLDHHAV